MHFSRNETETLRNDDEEEATSVMGRTQTHWTQRRVDVRGQFPIMSNGKSLQVCHCGWSKETTYQGLRTHQGKKGCTPKGMSVPESRQIIINTFMPKFSYNLPPFELQGDSARYFDESIVIPRHLLDGLEQFKEVQTQQRLTFPSFSSPLEGASSLMYHFGNEACLPAADLGQTQPMVFDSQQKTVLPESTMKKENQPFFGSAQQPLQFSDDGNRTRNALDSVIGAQPALQSANLTSRGQTSDANTTVVTNGKENKPSQTLFSGTAAQKSVDFDSKKQPFIKPATFNAGSFALKNGDASMDQNFGTTLPNVSSMFDDKHQSQSAFGWNTGGQQFQWTNPEPPNAQTTAAATTWPMEMAGPISFKDLVVSDGALQLPSLGANSVTAPGNKLILGIPQSQSSSFPAQSAISPTGVQQTFSPQPGPKTPEGALKEQHKPGLPKQEFVQTSAPQDNSAWQNAATPTKEETKQSQTLFSGSTSPKTFDFKSKQQPVIKPATFNAQPIDSNTGDASLSQNFGTTLPNSSMFGDKLQSQSALGWTTSAQQFPWAKSEPPKAAATNTWEMALPRTNLSEGAQQQLSLSANPVAVKEDKPIFGRPQSESTSFSAQPVTSSTGAQQIPTTETRPKTTVGAAREHKPVSSSKPSPSTKSTGAPQTGSVDVAHSGPVTPKAALEEENKQFFGTPQSCHQSAAEGNKTRRQLDFSTGAQQAQTSLVIPTTTSQIILPPVDDTKDIDREAEKLRQLQRDQIKAELMQKIRSREQKLSEIRSCAKACKGSLDEEWLEINTVFSDVIHIVEEARKRALQPLENRKDKLKRDSQSLINKIQGDIETLEKAIQEVDTAADLDVSPLSNLKLKDFSKWNVDKFFAFGTLQSTVTVMMEQIQEELEKLAALELERALAFAVDVKLDPTTAHQCLIVSKDGKKVQDGGQSHQQQQLPPAGERFDMFGSILAANRFSSGRAYWEVEVGGKSGWDLGVASGKANRKGKLTLSPDKGYWAIVHYEGQKYAALTAPPVCLQLKEQPQKVGVLIDYEQGLVSFYDVINESHIYSFTKCSFDDGIFPYFSPHLKQNGKNSEPLVLTPMKN